MIRADKAHKVETGRGVRVGIMDTGVDGNHPDIKPNFNAALSRNFVKDMPDIDGPCEYASCVDPANEDDNEHERKERRGHDPTVMGDLVFASVVGGLLGAKIYYAILMHDMSSLFSRAGFVFFGGLIGGILSTTIVLWWKKLDFWRIADVAGITLAAGYSVGRTGCWAISSGGRS